MKQQYSKDFTRTKAGKSILTERDYANIGRAYVKDRKKIRLARHLLLGYSAILTMVVVAELLYQIKRCGFDLAC